jgi:hypothetical protein
MIADQQSTTRGTGDSRDSRSAGTWWPGRVPLASPTFGVAFDGANVWVTNAESVTKLRASDGALLGTFNIDAAGGVAFDRANVWVTSESSGTVTKL